MIVESFAFVFGAAIGSFLNVCIYRIPLKVSIISPGSRCPACQHPLRLYDNLPIVSYLWLKGKCRDCGAKISWRYSVVELLTAVLAVMLFIKFGFTLKFLAHFLFVSALLVVT
ncbi:MAG TPA: prepilin peptidase, partial [Smithella sp.]|nr:prepilin peptidase [Smithella sp.]